MRTPFAALALSAVLALPAAAGAESLAIAEAAAISPGIEKAEVAKVRALFEEALRETGIEVAGSGKRGAEFVASLSLAKADGELVLTAQVSRLELDLWAARAEARVQGATPESLAAAVQDLAGQLTLAMRTAPSRSAAQPAARPPALKLREAASPPAPAPTGEQDSAAD